MNYVYVIQSKKDGKFYTGATRNLRKRFVEHNNHEVFSAKNRGQFTLVYYEACIDEHDAFEREKFLKSGHGKLYLKNRLKRFLSLTGQAVKKVERDRPIGTRGFTPSEAGRAARPSLQSGFVALMSALIISAVLLIVITFLSYSGFNSRSNALDAEFKERSSALAEACVDQALLEIANDSTYSGNATTTLGADDKCYVGVVPSGSFPKTFQTRGIYGGSYTNLRITISATPAIISWQEIPNF